MKIGWIDVLKKAYGGTVYSDMVQSVLSKHHDLETINVGLENFKKHLYPQVLYRLMKISGEKDIWVRNFDSVITMPYDGTKGKNIALIFHVDQSFQPIYFRLPWAILERIFYRRLKEIDTIVTISKYWQDHFLKRGHPNVRLIYNGFDTDQFQFAAAEVDDFKRRFRLKNKPIVYIGNCQRIKGVVEVYERLKGMDIHLVTSGRREVEIGAVNLNLTYREYLLLLKASSVVITMSKFKEGWNRTAHEAMLCKTPVVGSGLGGMRELLEEGGQVICQGWDELNQKVAHALNHPELGEAGYAFAKHFTIQRFEAEWLDFFRTMDEEN